MMPNTDNNETNVIWSFLINAYAAVRFAIVATWNFISSFFFTASVNPPTSPPITTNANDNSTLTIMEQTLAEQPSVGPKLGAVDISSFEARRPAASPRDPEILLNAQPSCSEIDRAGSRGLAAGRRGSQCEQPLTITPKLQPYFMGKLVEDIIRKIASDYLSPADILKFAKLSKANLRLLQPDVQLSNLLLGVAHGKQDEVNGLLTKLPSESKAKLLLQADTFTDYSGRTFNCTAYEYAYWAKDTHMCRMLEAHMDAGTKASMLARIDAIKRDGLSYKQHGLAAKPSKHFDMAPLITAYTQYVEAYNNLMVGRGDFDTLDVAWLPIGLAQRDLPVHVINEYCRPDRSFDPLPTFKEDKLPRVVTYYDYKIGNTFPLFPLLVSNSSGLGFDFVLLRAALLVVRVGLRGGRYAVIDLAAVSHLDEIRTAELTQSRENLLPVAPESVRGPRPLIMAW